MAETRELQVILSSGEVTEQYIGGVTADEKVLTSAEIDAKIPNLTSIVPYTGATTDVNLGVNNIYAANIPTPAYGEMYSYENTAATTIGTQNVYHAVYHFGEGTLNGVTFTSGIEGTIASVADYSGTIAGTVLVTDVAHGLTTGDIITIHVTTNYNGTYAITKVTNDTFYITKAFVATNTGDWAMGSYLTCAVAGDYKITMSNTAFAASSNTLFKFEVNKNVTALDNIAASRKFASSDYGSMASSGIATLAVNDRIWLSVRNETSTTNITVRHSNINIHKL
jgi:hypothetical protein